MKSAHLVVVSVLALLGGCKHGSASSLAQPVALGPAQTVAGIRFAAPMSWTLGGPRPMRVATYSIPKAAGDSDDAECALFFFGAGQGGGVDANLARWLAQFRDPSGAPVQAFARREQRSPGGVATTFVDVSGTFLFSATPMAAETTPRPNERLLGAIIEAPEGAVFVKLTGPAATVAAAQDGFEALLGSIEKAG